MRRLWDDKVPASGPSSLQSHISRLRTCLRDAVEGGVGIDFRARSYVLEVPPESVDLRRFKRLRQEARGALRDRHPEQAVTLLRRAESLWRGEPLAEFTGTWAGATRRRLTEDLRQVREERIRCELELGQHADLVGELYDLVHQEPGFEPYVGFLMLALHRSGRYGDALKVYRDTHTYYAEELGAEPGSELALLHQRVLRRDPGLLEYRPTAPDRPALPPADPPNGRTRKLSAGPAPAHTAPAAGPDPVGAVALPDPPGPTGGATLVGPPDNLPPDIGDFTGRRHELARLLAGTPAGATALPLTVVHGLGGVGKTALVTHAAHLLRDRYPDGRFHVPLRAHHEQAPVDPADALEMLLRTVGETGTLPVSLDGRAALWRERTAHRSVLVVLDDARSADQIRPLLPGAPTCRVLVTSRYRLVDLEGAEPVSLDLMDTSEAAAMFVRIGERGGVPDPDMTAVRHVVELCDRHPLAIRLTANRYRHGNAWTVRDLADRLLQSPNRLDEIDLPPGAFSAFDLSYAGLEPAHQRLIRFLALHPGPDITLDTARVLTGCGAGRVRDGVHELLHAHLLEETLKDRYRLHDMVRDFARKVGERVDPEAERRRAVERLLEHYLAVADHCDRIAFPHRRRLDVTVARPYESRPQVDSADSALAWFDLNRANLTAAARAAAVDHPALALSFPHVLDRAFHVWGMWELATELNASALSLARNHPDPAASALVLLERATLLRLQGAHEEALWCAEDALRQGRERGDPWLRGEAVEQIGIVHLVSDRLPEARRRFEEALALHQRAGNRTGEAEARNHQGIVLAFQGELREAAVQFRAMLDIHRADANIRGQIKALNNIGEVYSLEGRQGEARAYYERSLALVRQVGGRQELAILYNNLGNCCHAAGSTEQAIEYFGLALENYQAIGDRAGQTDSLVNLGIAYQATGRAVEARSRLAAADRIAREMGDQYQRQRVLATTAAMQYEAGEVAAALATYQVVARIAAELSRPYDEASAMEAMAGIIEEHQGSGPAGAYWSAALALYERLENTGRVADIRRRIGSDDDHGATPPGQSE